MYLPAALHGIEASLLASDSLRKLRSSIHKVVWSRRQPFASVGAFLSLLDGPTGCDPAFLCGREDRLGNDAADDAADFGRRRVSPVVIDARRNFSGVCGRWYSVILDLHRFFIAVARAVVNHDGLGGTALNPLVWSASALRKRRRLVHAVRDRGFCLDLLVFGIRSGFRFQLLPSVLMMLLFGLTLLVFWSSGSLS